MCGLLQLPELPHDCLAEFRKFKTKMENMVERLVERVQILEEIVLSKPRDMMDSDLVDGLQESLEMVELQVDPEVERPS